METRDAAIFILTSNEVTLKEMKDIIANDKRAKNQSVGHAGLAGTTSVLVFIVIPT